MLKVIKRAFPVVETKDLVIQFDKGINESKIERYVDQLYNTGRLDIDEVNKVFISETNIMDLILQFNHLQTSDEINGFQVIINDIIIDITFCEEQTVVWKYVNMEYIKDGIDMNKVHESPFENFVKRFVNKPVYLVRFYR